MDLIKVLVFSTICIGVLLSCQEKTESKEIIFVCTHGAARSPIASAYFNKLANENELKFHSTFRGTNPDKNLTHETINGLQNDGFNIGNKKPIKISPAEAERAYKIITFDCEVNLKSPVVLKEEWNGTPSISQDYKIARTTIKNHVERLILELKNNSN